MDIKLIVTDLDGTLLREDKTISDYTQDVLRRVQARGIKVAYATGRGCHSVELFPPGMFDGCAYNNGAVSMVGGTVVYERFIQAETGRKLLMACDNRGMVTGAQRGRKHYTNFDVHKRWGLDFEFEIVDFEQYNLNAEKIYVEECVSEDAEFIENHLPDEAYVILARDGLAMIMHREARKSNAVMALAQHWGIMPAEMVAFGDDLNDIDMLTACGTGVVMDDAIDEVKAVSTVRADTNENDGVAKWLEANVLSS
ncbi:MAG: Cof-type HAD-IIB family hydrolase [Oscillospiraceae bacterium]|nr:Cof-type HAD-IIB family hydrolase [Oscillospiraceae bacterium]